jgi:hypothetical protein
MKGYFQFVLWMFVSSWVFGSVRAATIIGTEGRYEGKILSQTDEAVSLVVKSGSEIKISREKILAIYDERGQLLWQHPSIIEPKEIPNEDRTAEKLPTLPALARQYTGLHFTLAGAFGIVGPNGSFSSFPVGSGPAYDRVIEINAGAAWYLDEVQALVVGAGYASRNLSIRGITTATTAGDGYWPMETLDLRAGYRRQSDIFFIEFGILGAVDIARPNLLITTASGSVASSAYATHSFMALYAALGLNFKISEQLFCLTVLRVDHGISAAASGAVPTSTGINGSVISTAEMSLLPLAASVQIGVGWRL